MVLKSAWCRTDKTFARFGCLSLDLEVQCIENKMRFVWHSDTYLVYLHELGEGLRPLNGHLDDVCRRRHG